MNFVGVVLYNFRHHLRNKNMAPCVETTSVRPFALPSVCALASETKLFVVFSLNSEKNFFKKIVV